MDVFEERSLEVLKEIGVVVDDAATRSVDRSVHYIHIHHGQ